MEFIPVKNGIGDTIRIPFDGTDHYCPICAHRWGEEPVYSADGWPSSDICPGCKIQFGDDDVPRHKHKGLNTEQYYKLIRIQWLNENNWDESLLKKLRDILGINTEELRAIAQK